MTPEPLTADERPRVSDERLALLIHAMPFVDPKSAQDEFIAVIADLRDARARIAEVEREREEGFDWLDKSGTTFDRSAPLAACVAHVVGQLRGSIEAREAAETALAEARARFKALDDAVRPLRIYAREYADAGVNQPSTLGAMMDEWATAIEVARGGPANG